MRVHLALNVRDLERAVAYYTKALGAPPAKRKPGYANFALDHPPLKLTLLEASGASERLNHVGVETFDDADVAAATERLEAAGLADKVERDATCCYARQDKVWTSDPDGVRWEWYRVLADAETFGEAPKVPAPAPGASVGGCCGAAAR